LKDCMEIQYFCLISASLQEVNVLVAHRCH
jgi:hypothetical protein